MNINIFKAGNEHIADCTIALQNSDLGRTYFSQENTAIQAINDGISKGEIIVDEAIVDYN